MNAIVFGANGFLGEHIVHALLRRSARVSVVVRPGTKPLFDDRVAVLEGDLFDAEFVRACTIDKDAVFFAAGRTWQPGLPLDEYQRQNVGMVRTLVAVIEGRTGCRVVYTSSLATIAGSSEPLVFTEASGRENVCEAWLTPYDRAKIEAERIICDCAQRGQSIVVLNPGLMLGPGASLHSKVNNPFALLWHAQGKSPFYVDAGICCCDVRDVAEAHISAIERGRSGQRYIMGGHNLQRSEFFDRLARLVGIPPPRRIPCSIATAVTAAGDALGALSRGLLRTPFHRSFVRAQGLHYLGSSDSAVRELNYQVRPLEMTILDTLKHDAARGLLPAHLDFVSWLTVENARELLCLKQIVARHAFAASLLPRLATLHEACTSNHQLYEALTHVMQKSEFSTRRASFRIPRAGCREALNKLRLFLDYVYFACDDFLADVL